MKKQLFSFVLLSFISFFATNADAQKMYIGARIGTNLANETTDSLPSGVTLGIDPGFLAGGQFDYWFDNTWALSAQVLYDQKGTKESISQSGEGYSSSGTADLIFNYLEIPILVKATFGTGNIRPYVFAGPSIGFFLSGSGKINATGTFDGVSSSSDTTISIADSTVKSPDISVVFGAGISLQLNSGQILFIDAAYALGLVNIENNNNNGSTTTINSRDIRLAAGILFPLN